MAAIRLTQKQLAAITKRTGQVIPEAAKPTRATRPAKKEESPLVVTFCYWWRILCSDLAAPRKERPFHQYFFDLSWEPEMVVVEINGWGHKTDSRWQTDQRKINQAQIDGWLVLQFPSERLQNDPEGCIKEVRVALQERQRAANAAV